MFSVGREDLPPGERGGVPLPPGVSFIPYVPIGELQKLVETARLIVLPLPERGQSLGQLSLLFCMAMGKPVVCSRIIGIADYLDDGENGLFCAPGNAQEMAEAIKRLLDDPALAERLGRSARETVTERFSDVRMGHAWQELTMRVAGLTR